MPPFTGFPAKKTHLTPIPAAFFTELLAEIDDLAELKVTLYALWFLDRQEGNVRYIYLRDFANDRILLKGLGHTAEEARLSLSQGLECAVQRGALLVARAEGSDPLDAVYFLNSPRGRAALQALERGEWAPDPEIHQAVALEVERPNIYRLYEENIGPLTPMIADTLKDAEQTYSTSWIEDAMRISIQSNKRSWRYVEAILRKWKESGRDDKDRRSDEKNRRKYVEGEYADFIEH